ncbi:MAG: ankyrin repeat domain-containing protein, partial [Bdellovibrionia bacterium]
SQLTSVLALPLSLNIDYRDALGYTALMLASQEGHLEAVVTLIERYGSIISLKDFENHLDAYDLAGIRGHSAVLDYLRSKGAGPVVHPFNIHFHLETAFGPDHNHWR